MRPNILSRPEKKLLSSSHSRLRWVIVDEDANGALLNPDQDKLYITISDYTGKAIVSHALMRKVQDGIYDYEWDVAGIPSVRYEIELRGNFQVPDQLIERTYEILNLYTPPP